MFKDKKSKDIINKDAAKEDKTLVHISLSKSLEENIKLLKNLFIDDDTLITRQFQNQQDTDIKYCIFFIEGMVNTQIINENIIKPIVLSSNTGSRNNVDIIMNRVILSNNLEKTSEVNKLIEAIINGNTVLLIEGEEEAITISTKGWSTRAIEEPQGEKIIRGPREGFNESIMMNLSMIRRRLLTHDLKFKFRFLGVKSHTKICLCYIDGIVNKKILDEVQKRLDTINMDGILASGYIQELVRDSPWSPFKTLGSTERPDIIAAKLLEGRIAILVDGTPVALTIPHVFIEYFQANEDYYINFYFSSISRLVRMLSFIITISLPAIFIALIAYHQEMIPTPLAISIAAARQNVPFPSAVAMFGLLVVFEILRETGTRMPESIGQAFSIVGTLVIGQAAVEARFVSAPMVIVSALTGITGLAIPRIKGAAIILRFTFLLLASILGLYGYIFGAIGLLIHLFDMRSFGVPYMLNLMNLNAEDIKDTAIRAPWMFMKYRPQFIAVNNRIRNTSGGKKK
ncbi:MAG TPA: spore germination protein [Clostridia bacterium]